MQVTDVAAVAKIAVDTNNFWLSNVPTKSSVATSGKKNRLRVAAAAKETLNQKWGSKKTLCSRAN